MPWVIVATVVPLCLLQVPFGEFVQLTDAATAANTAGSAAALLRSGSLALPFLVAAVPLSALAVRRFGAWSVLSGGLLVIVAGDVLAGLGGGQAGTSPALAGTVSAMHGTGAGLAFPVTAAQAAGRSAAWARTARRGWPLAAWWAAVTVSAFAAAPGLSRPGPADGGWWAAFGPVPWLTAVALAAVILSPLLAGRPWPLTRRADRAGDPAALPPPGNAQFTLLVPPAAALAVIAVAASYQPRDTIVAAALCEVAGLLTVAVMVPRGAAGDRWPMACAVAGFVIAPASAGLLSLRAMAVAGTAGAGATDALLAAAAVVGAVLGAGTAAPGRCPAAQDRRWHGVGSRTATAHAANTLRPVAGLLVVGTALIVASLTGPFASPVLLGVLIAAVTGGLAAALATAADEVTTAGAMAGVAILACGTLVGYLAAAAVGVRFGLADAGGQRPVPHGLVTAFGWWTMAAAAAAVTVAAIQWTRRTRHEPPRHEPPRHEPPRHELHRHELRRHELWRHELRRHEPPRHEAHRHDPFRHDLFRHEAHSHEPGGDPDAARRDKVPGDQATVGAPAGHAERAGGKRSAAKVRPANG